MEVFHVIIESTVRFYFLILPLLIILIGKAVLLTYRIPSHKNLLEMNKFSLYAICAILNLTKVIHDLVTALENSVLVFQLYFHR